jgi:hypothetical protein
MAKKKGKGPRLEHVTWGNHKFTVAVSDSDGIVVAHGHLKTMEEVNAEMALWVDAFYMSDDNDTGDPEDKDIVAVHTYSNAQADGFARNDEPVTTVKFNIQDGRTRCP